jgi:ABC-type glycerol-3-phosphate transport system substrate-binding protein
MPPTLDFVARVDRARDLQATRGEALREGIDVEVVPVGFGSFSHELPDQDRLATARRTLAAGQRIDVIWTPLVDLGDLHRDRQITPIASHAAKDHLDLKAYSPQALQPAFAPDRGLVALPSEISARQLYFRTDLLAEAGIDFRRAGLDFERPSMTWDAFRRIAVESHASPAGRNRFSVDPMSEALPAAAWAWQAGLPVARPTLQGLDAVADALGWLAALAQEINLGPTRKVPNRSLAVRYGSSGPPTEGVAVGRDDVSRHLLLTGGLTLAFDSTRLVSTIAAHDASLPIRVVELPRRTGGSPNVGWSEVSGYALMTGSSDDAWDLLKYMTGEDAAYASARAVAMRLPQIERPGSMARAPEDLPGGPRWWFPPYSGRLGLDRFMAKQYRTGVKVLDEAHDHGMEQLRSVGILPLAPGTRTWLAALEAARRAVLREGRSPRDAAREAISASQLNRPEVKR